MLLTVSGHSQSQTLLQAAVLAAVAVGSVDEAVPLTGTGVGRVVLLAPSEETLIKKQGQREYGLIRREDCPSGEMKEEVTLHPSQVMTP